MSHEKRAVVSLSGGQDSTTCLAWAINEGWNVWPVTVDYGQRHRREIESAKKVAELACLGDRHEIITLPDVLKSTSPLVDKSRPVGLYETEADLPGGLEATFVPARNPFFLTLMANRAAALGAKAIIIGVSQEDYGGYFDCREDFIQEMEHAMSLALYGDTGRLSILTPLIHMTKRETVELAYGIGSGTFELLAYSHTCYNGDYPPCGHCHACLLRAKGFKEAGLEDPLMVRAKREGRL